MPSTFSCLHVHVIFATKERFPLIKKAWMDRLHAFLGSVMVEREVVPVAIGGVADHVHVRLRIKPVHSLADIVRDLKAVSSKWIRDERLEPAFAWQEGYGAFSVSPTNLEAVVRYIGNQEEHHRTRSSEEEFRDFLNKAGIPVPP